jgi:hypothetical protein
MTEEAIAVEIRAKRTAGEVVVRVQRSPLSPHADRAVLEAGADAPPASPPEG